VDENLASAGTVRPRAHGDYSVLSAIRHGVVRDRIRGEPMPPFANVECEVGCATVGKNRRNRIERSQWELLNTNHRDDTATVRAIYLADQHWVASPRPLFHVIRRATPGFRICLELARFRGIIGPARLEGHRTIRRSLSEKISKCVGSDQMKWSDNV